MSSALRQEDLNWLPTAVPEVRLQHILRVEQMAIALAYAHQLSVVQVPQAALMHDLAKCFTPDKLLAIAAAEGWELAPTEQQVPHLLHVPVGAVVARERFGIIDETVLRAIATHTLGSPNMAAIGAVVYLADALEPGRDDSPSLHHLRQLSYGDLWRATYETCVVSLQHLLNHRRPAHPRIILTHNRLLTICRQATRSVAA